MSGICLSSCFVFRKPTRPSLPLRKAFSNSSLSIVFTTPSVPLVGDRNPFQRELHLFPQAPSSSEGGGCNRSSSELSFRKPTSPPLTLREGPPLISVFSPQGRRGNRPTRCSNRYAIRLADHQRSAPGFCAGWDRMDMELLTSAETYCLLLLKCIACFS